MGPDSAAADRLLMGTKPAGHRRSEPYRDLGTGFDSRCGTQVRYKYRAGNYGSTVRYKTMEMGLIPPWPTMETGSIPPWFPSRQSGGG